MENIRTEKNGIRPRREQYYLIKAIDFPVEVIYQEGMFGDEKVREPSPLCYIMTCMDYFKVGVSVCPHERRNTLMAQTPIEIEIHRIYKVKPPIRAHDLERTLHNALANHKYRGEWFHKTGLDLIQHRAVNTVDIWFNLREVKYQSVEFEDLYQIMEVTKHLRM